MKPKSKSGPVQLKPLLAATLRQARRLTHRSSHTPAPPITPTPITATPSLFLTVLPREIRALIYDSVFAGRELLVGAPYSSTGVALMHKIAHLDIKSEHAGGKWQAGWRGFVARDYPEEDQYLEFKEERVVVRELLGLALCCRQVYVESIRFLYSSIGFTFLYQCSLGKFVEGDKRRADHMRWVRVFRLEFGFAVPVIAGGFDVSEDPEYEYSPCTDWNETCRCLGLMTGLEVLHVSIRPTYALAEREWAGDMVWAMLELLKLVRADEFRVTVGRQFIKFRKMLGETPFELCEAYEEY
ncbi:hypothetical protein VE03_05852 [Pseudogymnoascus sp. 23342-1-I1]|nr:hypothetical protein VE03_05852 [Pseudogymnoascus sp. 23342-1-I1]